MKYTLTALGLALLLIGGALLSSAASKEADCCFTNPRYTGQCRVTPGDGEKCADILSYLNNQNSVGKSYCGNTTIRGGWASVTCEEKQLTPLEGITEIQTVDTMKNGENQ